MTVRRLGSIVSPDVMGCLMELVNYDELEFTYNPQFQGPPLFYDTYSRLEEMPDSLGKNFLKAQLSFNTMLRDTNQAFYFFEEDVSVVYITVPEGTYYFLMLGDNGIVAIAYLNNNPNIWNFFLLYPIEDDAFEYEWRKVGF